MREINTEKKKRWVSLYVENRIGVLARISGMMSGKSYNISSITVGVTEDPTVSRMTIGLSSENLTFFKFRTFVYLYKKNLLHMSRCISNII